MIKRRENTIDGKRQRSVNFTDDNRKLLLMLIKPYVKIIENKNGDKATSLLKNETWTKIMKMYNDKNIHHRTPLQLKLCYEAIKYKLRKNMKSAVSFFLPNIFSS